ncbi:MAG TPA: hypothetical protein VML55_26035 [Planctomycetaceae bacterium]|nr:hypothetical protein [Planctomycetaceae bacterium]
MNVHRIHLKGPWEIEWLGPEQPADERAAGPRRVHMPAPWEALFGDAAGTARFRRRFNRPTNLDPQERVFIVFDGIGGQANVSLNARCVGTVAEAAPAAEFDVTAVLESRNVLIVDVAFNPAERPQQPGGLWAAVALEIRSAARRLSSGPL